jgi:predicted Zn-dependent protease
MRLLPDLPAVRNTRGAVLVALGRDQEGIDLMEPTLVAVAPSHRASSHASLALAHARQGRVFEARRHIASAIRLEHRFPLLEEAMILAGAMETAVVRGYLERWSPEQAVHEIRKDAGEAAAALGLALRAHIEATGRDHDLVPVAEALVP